MDNIQVKEKKFRSMLGLTIFCTILFSFVAFPGILYASKANTQFALGNVDEAVRLNKKASIWCWTSAIITVALLLLHFSGTFGTSEGPVGKKTLMEKITQARGKAV
jgi:hypothetical protein